MHIDVPGTGKPDARILIVGEQPGRQEMQTGRPFVGPAGRELDTNLARAGITRRECYLTNVIKTLRQPLQTFYNSETGVFYESAKPYIDYLREEILRVSPNILVAVGNVALSALCSRKGITKWRGSLIESTLIPGLKVVPIVHPAFTIPPKNQWKYRPLSVLDLSKVARESEFPELHHTERELLTGPTYHECLSFLDECYYAGLSGQTIDCDIEVSLETREITCIAFALSPTRAMSIPFIGPRGDYFTPEQEIEIWQAIAAILEHPEITKAGQNFIFDSFFLLHRYHISISGRIEDTMIAQKILCPDLPVGLDIITSIHTDIPYYKGEGKEWIVNKVGTFQNFWEYNAMDTIATAAARESQLPELHRQKNYETYLRTCRVIYPLLYMMQRGVLTDIAGMISHREKVVKEIEALEAELTNLAGYQLNYNSPKQLKQYFYETKGLKPYKKRGAKGSVVTTDVDAMKRIARKGYREASIILDLRHKTTKALGVYLNPEKVDPDGRYRCHYNPAGTDSGRLSSSSSIFGTGSNRQNWPHQYLRYLLIDPGYVGYWFDLAQAENRIVAYVGNVLEMIEAFESGADLHSLTGALISGKSPEEVKKEDEENVCCHLGDGSRTWRYYGKKSNHCLFTSARVLTKSGWIPIAEAARTWAEIAQWNPETYDITFVKPSAWFEDNYTGDQIVLDSQRIYHKSTPEHRMPILYDGAVIEKTAGAYPSSGTCRALLAGYYTGGPFAIHSDLIRFLVAFQADGWWNYDGIDFALTKERKKDRLIKILEGASIPHSVNKSGISISAKSTAAALVAGLLGRDKTFGPWLLELDLPSLYTFISELRYWDGSVDKNIYFTTNKNNAEWVQTIAHLCGMACNIGMQDNSKTNAFGNKMVYRVSLRESTKPATHTINKYTLPVYDEKIYCPTVPTGYFLVKEGGKICVTGNSINYDIGPGRFSMVLEIQQKEGKWLIDQYYRAYPGVRHGYQKSIRDMLHTSRMVPSLMGRRRLFLGPLDAETYRTAYAQLPQSSVGDKVNEHGLNYIYYNPQKFGPIELLEQVHDSIGFQIPLTIPWPAHAEMLWDIKQSLEQPYHWHGREFVVPADLTIGLNFCKEEGIDIKYKAWPKTPKELAGMLEERYQKLLKDPEVNKA